MHTISADTLLRRFAGVVLAAGCAAQPLQAAGVAGVVPGAQADAVPAVRFAPEKDYGPFVFQDESGRVVGLSVDMLEAIRPDLQGEVQTLPPQALADILEAARQGEVDLISSLRPNPERAAYLAFTAPYVQIPAVLVVRQTVRPPSLSDMDGFPVAVGKGYGVEAFVRRAYPKVRWVAVANDTEALRALQSGQVVGVVADIASVSFAVRQHKLQGLQVTRPVGFDYPLSFAYRKELTALGQQLEAGLQRLPQARRQALVDKWLQSPQLHFEDTRRVFLRWAGLALVLLALAWLLWRFRHQLRLTGAGHG